NDFAVQPTLTNVTGTNQLTCAVTTINVQVNDAISYTWSGGLSTGSINNSFNSPDTYVVDVLDANNCPSQLSATITQNINPPTPGINNLSNNLILTCSNPTINVQATGGVSYQWSSGLSNTANQSLTQPGTYTVTVIGSNACAATSSITITSDQTAPTAIITNNTGSTVLHCNQTQVNVTASGGVSYLWSNGLGTNPTVNLTAGGTYTVTVTAANGCTDTETITINQLQNPTVTVSAITMCAGAIGTLTAVPSTPGGTFVWTQFPSNVQLPGNTASVSISPTTNSIYNVQYFDTYNCPSNTSMANVTVNPTPVANISGTNSICSGNTAILTANSSLTGANGFYTWSPITSSSQTVSVTPMTSTNYSVIYTFNGCPSAATNHLVTVYQTPVVSVNNVGICTGAQATLTAVPDIAGGTYSWNTFPTAAITQSITVQPAATSTFTVVYTSLNNCPSQSATATVTVTNVPSVQLDDISVCEGQSGTLTAVPSVPGGVFIWAPSNGTSASTYTILPTTSTTVSIIYSLNDCPSPSATAQVTLVNTPSVTVENIGICQNQFGTLIANPSTPGGTYLWSTNETTQSISINPQSDSTYSVIYFLSGCPSPQAMATVTVDPIPVVTFDVDLTEGCLPLTVNLTNTTSNTTNCTWNIENNGIFNECGDFSYTFQNTGCFDIALTTNSLNGCSNTLILSDLICAFPSPIADFTLSSNELNVSDPIVTINNNSTGAVDYIWNYGDNTTDTSIYNPEPHLYGGYLDSMYTISLIAISENGCVDSMQQIITFNDEVTIYAPNSFTPDEDGLNEIWLPVISSGINPNAYQLRIFNRWGQEFFATNNILQGWDGTFLGDKVQDGTYSFQLTYMKSGQTKKNVIVGHINLIR
ncbi:MAG: gliding motility-associated C-terminal domain-containing protein, partial [Crocinitomicaceae bacterium]|nr:gliding motility-associated C-terminal domain-containing protein [Crocinitomicaceae bacterium]